jgi:hypothetical protein
MKAKYVLEYKVTHIRSSKFAHTQCIVVFIIIVR